MLLQSGPIRSDINGEWELKLKLRTGEHGNGINNHIKKIY